MTGDHETGGLTIGFAGTDFDTVVGSFGLVTVAPFTAIMAGLMLTHKNNV